MKIVFFGAGAIGAFYGAMLARAEAADVWFVARGAQLAAMRERGLRIETKYGDFTLEKPQTTGDTKEIGWADLVVVSVKEYQTAGILDALTPLVGANTILMPFQNGVDGDAVLAERFGAERVIGGVPIISVNLIEPGFVRHVASGEIAVGEFGGNISERVEKIVEAFQKAGIPTQVSTNIREVLWHKLLWNAGFTSLICLTGCDSHEIMDVPEACKLVRQAIAETISVGKAQGFNFAPNHLELIFEGTRAQPPIRTSMLFDREAGRPLEYEAITGAVIRHGKYLGVPTPINDLLYGALKVIDAHNRRKSAQNG
jgi:2-dehydropantoate 2-reductase